MEQTGNLTTPESGILSPYAWSVVSVCLDSKNVSLQFGFGHDRFRDGNFKTILRINK